MERMYKGIRAPAMNPYVDKAAGGKQGGSALLKDSYGDTRDVAARGRETSSVPTTMTRESRMLEDNGYESGFPVHDRFDCASLSLPLPLPLPSPLPSPLLWPLSLWNW